jgi:hypothetical protein
MTYINSKFKILGVDIVNIAKIYNHFENVERHIISVATTGESNEYVVRVLNYNKDLTDYRVSTIGREIEILTINIIQNLQQAMIN